MGYIKTTLKEEFSIKEIVTIHYFEFARDYVFEGERHNFWEFVYVDKGEIEVMADTKGYNLKQGEIIFHKPNEFHNLWANGVIAPNAMVVSFACDSPSMSFFENKILRIGDDEKNLLADIIKEAKKAFSSPLGLSLCSKLEERHDLEFGSEQLIQLYIELLLIYLVRLNSNIKTETRLSSSVKERSEADIVKRILNYLNENVNGNINFDDVCKFSRLSKTNLKVIFKEKMGISVMEYYKSLKIEEAKRMIREETYNFTQIADRLAYASIHYFSRHFKKVTGMTPSEYSLSVKVKI